MGLPAAGAAGLSMLSTGLSVFSNLQQGNAQAKGLEFQAQAAENAAIGGQIKAAQTSTALHQDLMKTLSNIQSMRATAATEDNSPTGTAILNRTNALGQQDINRKVGNILEQSQEEKNAAAFYQQSASNALLGGQLGAAGSLLKGVAGLPFLGQGGLPNFKDLGLIGTTGLFGNS